MNDTLRKVFVENAVKSYRQSDKSRWKSALWCWKVVGNYERGATLGLADDMGVSTDTIEDMAHSYSMFVDLCNHESGTYRKFVFASRNAPYIYHSHFRALHDAKEKYSLTLAQCLDLLMDVVQSEGVISSRKIDDHTRSRYGAETDWRYDAQKLMKKLYKLNTDPNLPKKGRKKVRALMDFIGHNA